MQNGTNEFVQSVNASDDGQGFQSADCARSRPPQACFSSKFLLRSNMALSGVFTPVTIVPKGFCPAALRLRKSDEYAGRFDAARAFAQRRQHPFLSAGCIEARTSLPTVDLFGARPAATAVGSGRASFSRPLAIR